MGSCMLAARKPFGCGTGSCGSYHPLGARVEQRRQEVEEWVHHQGAKILPEENRTVGDLGVAQATLRVWGDAVC
jgi:hypothetical protein